MSDIPFLDAASRAIDLINRGLDVYQEFTCEHCGQRLTMEEPNKFFKIGTCDKCGHETNIARQGCGYLVHAKPL